MTQDVLGDSSGDTFDVTVDERETKVRLSSQLYDSLGKVFRELYTNSETSTLQLPDGIEENGEIIVDIFTDGQIENPDSSIEVRVQDNGIGMSKQEIEKVLAKFTEQGMGSNTDSSKLVSKFGIGFFSVFAQAGKNGLIRFEAAPIDEEKVNRCLMTLDEGGFVSKEEYEKYVRQSMLSPDEHGMVVDYMVKDTNHSPNEFFEWATRHAYFIRVPVSVRIRDSDDGEIMKQTYLDAFELENLAHYNSKELLPENLSQLDRNKYYCYYEDEYIELIASPSLQYRGTLDESMLILVSYPLDDTIDTDLFGTCVARFKTEQPVVINEESINYQKIVTDSVSNAEDNPQKYVLRNNLRDDDVVIPTPTTNRDSIHIEEKDKLEAHFKSILEQERDEFLREIIPKTVEEATHRGVDLLPSILDTVFDYNFSPGYRLSKFDSLTENTINTAFGQMMRTFDLGGPEISRLTEMSSNASVYTGVDTTENTHFHTAMKKYGNGANVFVCISENEDKIHAVFDHFDNPTVISVQSTKFYELAEEYNPNVSLLKNITKSKVEELDVSYETEQRFGLVTVDADTDTDYGNEELVLHAGRSRDDKETVTVSYLCSEAPDLPAINGMKPNRIVAFPNSTDESIRDYYSAASSESMMVSCRNSILEVLQDNLDNVVTIDGKIQSLKSEYGFTKNYNRVSLYDIWNDSSDKYTVLPFKEKYLSVVLRYDCLSELTEEFSINGIVVYVHENIARENKVAFINTKFSDPTPLGSPVLRLNSEHKEEFREDSYPFRSSFVDSAFGDSEIEEKAKDIFTKRHYSDLEGVELELVTKNIELLTDRKP